MATPLSSGKKEDEDEEETVLKRNPLELDLQGEAQNFSEMLFASLHNISECAFLAKKRNNVMTYQTHLYKRSSWGCAGEESDIPVWIHNELVSHR